MNVKAPPYVRTSLNAGAEEYKQEPATLYVLPKLSSGEMRILALRKQLAALEGASVACADGA